MNILIIGSGGREHALVRQLAAASPAPELYALPGNPGTAELAAALSECETVAQLRAHRRVEGDQVQEPVAAGDHQIEGGALQPQILQELRLLLGRQLRDLLLDAHGDRDHPVVKIPTQVEPGNGKSVITAGHFLVCIQNNR